ncbi:MAG: 50S ribosomal protein L11 methyltransferase [Candidatus Omnitrophica bacterium]|nr:50S ribosomal protein L11 methyltransferase [Candidatus Omnitrophota bacterium]
MANLKIKPFFIVIFALACVILVHPSFARRVMYSDIQPTLAVMLSAQESRSLGEEVRKRLGLNVSENPDFIGTSARMKFSGNEIEVDWYTGKRYSPYCRIGSLIFLEYSNSEELDSIRKKLGEDILDRYGGNIIFYSSHDDAWQERSFREPFLHSSTITAIAGMLQYGTEGKIVADIGSGRGILSIVALRLGAAKVFAVENNLFYIEKSLKIMEANGYQIDPSTLRGERIEFFNSAAEDKNLGLPDRALNSVQMIISNTGPLYQGLTRLIIEAAGSLANCREIIIVNYDLPEIVDEYDTVVRKKISISKNIYTWMEKSGFAQVEMAPLEFIFFTTPVRKQKVSELFFGRK